MRVWEQDTCVTNYKTLDRDVLDTMMCAGETNRDSCQVKYNDEGENKHEKYYLGRLWRPPELHEPLDQQVGAVWRGVVGGAVCGAGYVSPVSRLIVN